MMDGRRRRRDWPISWWRLPVVLWLVISVADAGKSLSKTHVSDAANNTPDRANRLSSSGVQLIQLPDHVVMKNDIISLTLTVPGGGITSITYRDGENLLQIEDKDEDNGHWNIVWNEEEGAAVSFDKLEGTNFSVIVQNESQTEISFTKTWEVGSSGVPLNIDKRYILLSDSPGFYSYSVLERLEGWPAFHISEGRIVFQLEKNRFHYMAMSDERQRYMPMPEDRATGQVLDYKEAVLLTNPINPNFKGEVDDKYFYTCNDEDNKVHGWVSNDDPPVGFWLITPSDEFRAGGPIRQDLTSHVGPITLAKFSSRHYAGEDLAIKFEREEYWKKVIGPFYIHMNSDASANGRPSMLWEKAKQRMEEEVKNWPYDFPISEDFVKSDQRGSISGRLLVQDWFLNKDDIPGGSAYVGLAPPGPAGSWQYENKGYQFWTHADDNGNFEIHNVIPGNYSLFAWVPGFLGDYKHEGDIAVAPGSDIVAKDVIFKAPRVGPTLWEIGIPDRSAAEFFIPDPDPKFKIHKFRAPIEKFRQYGLWARYSDLYPDKDLIFTIGSSNYTQDWFFAHVTRNVGKGQYVATTWQIIFDLQNINKSANYTLRLALASAHNAELQVRIKDPNSAPHFTTGLIGKDNALARHGVRGLYHFYTIGIEGTRLVSGNNTLFLTQAKGDGVFKEVMYDYIRLEGPAP